MRVNKLKDVKAETRKSQIVEGLANFFGPEAYDYLEYKEKLWNHIEYSGGCPTANVLGLGCMKDFPAIREPFGNVHFCGTETASKWIGHMDGAIESGIRAAYEIHRLTTKAKTHL